MDSHKVTNFGRNIAFAPQNVCAPRSEEELLEMLAEHRGKKIHAVGSLHSWSEAPIAEEILLDLRHLNEVRIKERNGRKWVTAQAGCRIKQVLTELERHGAGTIPSMGLITEQTIAGAISTGTHGSGQHAMSHFVEEVRIAHYDSASGAPVVRTIDAGAELRAAQCALGSFGIIVSVSFWARPQYQIEEHFRRYHQLDDVLAAETSYPLQQFFLMPWLWEYIAQHRRETLAPRSALASLYRAYFFIAFDILLHLCILSLVCVIRSPRAARLFLRHVAPRTVVPNWIIVDRSDKMLIMEHELFRHIEIEIFVKRSRLGAAIEHVTRLIRHFDGDGAALDATARAELDALGLLGRLNDCQGRYTHHYPICVRRVLPDDTLLSMSSGGNEPWYAISFISYARPDERAGFFAFAEILAKSLAAQFEARPHWGKVCPLAREELDPLYPELPRFRAMRAALDPERAFLNRWTEHVLGQVASQP